MGGKRRSNCTGWQVARGWYVGGVHEAAISHIELRLLSVIEDLDSRVRSFAREGAYDQLKSLATGYHTRNRWVLWRYREARMECSNARKATGRYSYRRRSRSLGSVETRTDMGGK